VAQFGTAGVGDGDGDGEGDGDGLGEGLGDGVGDSAADGEGETCEATELVLPQAARTHIETSASTPTLRLTGHTNEAGWDGVTARTGDTGR